MAQVANTTKKVPASVIAEEWGVTRAAVLNWAKQGLIPSMRLGKRCIRFDADEVREALRKGGGH